MGQLAALRLQPGSENARRARQFVSTRLKASGAEEFIDNAVLLTTELVTNVIRHVGSKMTLVLSIAEDLVRISVSDGSPEAPVERQEAPPTDPGGRGLLLVDAIASAWGVERTADTKSVWFELAA